ncbi:alanine racemase [Candidatus Vondammii sp. HM_W22]
MGPSASLDLSALRHNLQRVRECAPNSRIFAVIKANAYGHGMLRAAAALADADAFAVARVEEGVKLREAGFQQKLLILEGFFNQQELAAASHHQLELAIHQTEQLETLKQQPLDKPVSCWLKVDSGMHRVGFQPDQALDAWKAVSQLSSVAGEVGLMTHLANGDDLGDPTSKAQFDRFLPLAKACGTRISIGNSAGILGWPDARTDWVRPGIMLYGASPFINGTGADDGLKPVMTFQSRLIAINHYPKGSPIGYSGTWRCPEAMPVGVVAVGYGDGYPRHAPAGTPVLLNGRRVPLVGRVSMDMITVDLRNQPEAKIGDPIVLWGAGLPVEEIAGLTGTISYELFCGVTGRVEFIEREAH